MQERFAWLDVIEDGKCAGWGWSQNCALHEGRVEIECLWLPEIMPGNGMKLHILAANHVTLIDYTDTGFVLRQYVANLPFTTVVRRLQQVTARPVHLVAQELLEGLAKEDVLIQLPGHQRRRRGLLTH